MSATVHRVSALLTSIARQPRDAAVLDLTRIKEEIDGHLSRLNPEGDDQVTETPPEVVDSRPDTGTSSSPDLRTMEEVPTPGTVFPVNVPRNPDEDEDEDEEDDSFLDDPLDDEDDYEDEDEEPY